MVASDQSPDCPPLAALLYEIGSVPDIDDVVSAAIGTNDFTVSHVPQTREGWAEVLRDGLTFDLHGLSGAAPVAVPDIGHMLGIEGNRLQNLCALQISPGPHLAGAQHLLPVIRVAGALAIALAKIGQPRAICWIPARNAVVPELFSRAVKPWLEGGPFPAMALASLRMQEDGGISSEGLKFLIGQEFLLSSEGRHGADHLARTAVRLVDWLVAHGPVTKGVKAVLAGTGAVFLEAHDSASIVARCT